MVPQRPTALLVEIESQIAGGGRLGAGCGNTKRTPQRGGSRSTQENERAAVHDINVGGPGSFVYAARRAVGTRVRRGLRGDARTQLADRGRRDRLRAAVRT